MAVVVFPTPPFWFATARRRGRGRGVTTAGSRSGVVSLTGSTTRWTSLRCRAAGEAPLGPPAGGDLRVLPLAVETLPGRLRVGHVFRSVSRETEPRLEVAVRGWAGAGPPTSSAVWIRRAVCRHRARSLDQGPKRLLTGAEDRRLSPRYGAEAGRRGWPERRPG